MERSYVTLLESLHAATAAMEEHKNNGVKLAQLLFRDTLNQWGGPERWWRFDTDFDLKGARKITPAIFMDPATRQFVFAIEMNLESSTLRITARIAITANNVAKVMVGSDTLEVEYDDPTSLAEFRAALFDTINGAIPEVFGPRY